MSLQIVARGEARTVVASVTLLTGPDGRTFALRMGRRGQTERFETTMTPLDDAETLTDGKVRVTLSGAVSAAQSALLSKGTVDLTIFATAPLARLVKAQVNVEDEIGESGILG